MSIFFIWKENHTYDFSFTVYTYLFASNQINTLRRLMALLCHHQIMQPKPNSINLIRNPHMNVLQVLFLNLSDLNTGSRTRTFQPFMIHYHPMFNVTVILFSKFLNLCKFYWVNWNCGQVNKVTLTWHSGILIAIWWL